MLKDTLSNLIAAAIRQAQADGSLPAFDLPKIEIMRPKVAEHGDYSCNAALIAASAIRKAGGAQSNPRQIAEMIAGHLPTGDLLAGAEIAGPGFINLRLADAFLQGQVAAITAEGSRFGDIERGVGEHWQVEYVSANPTGPIHYGGARNAVLGDTLANVLTAAGYAVQREFYVNDGGTQFRLFTETLYARYAQLLGRDEPVPADGYHGDYMLDYAQKLIDADGERFLHLEKSEAVAQIREIARRMVVESLQTQLGRIGVHFDRWFSEQSLYDESLIEQSLAYLDSRGELANRDGAVWFLASRYPNNDKDVVVVRSNGLPTYFAGDIAYHYDKFIRRQFDIVVDVWGVDHQGHVSRMAAMMQAFGLDPNRLIILMHDLVRLIRNGQEVKISKRAGNLITLDEVVDEVGSDALRFNLLTRSPESTIEFDLDLAVQQTSENPVYYIQYSHARLCSIRAKAADSGLAVADQRVLARLIHPSELTLIRKLIELEEQIEFAIEKLSPHSLTHYAIDLARAVNAFYRDCRVIDAADPELTAARLQLSAATQIVLAKVLGLMGISAPESM